MADASTRTLERSLQPGDPEGLAHLVSAYERAGDQSSLCELGYHDVDASKPKWDRGPRDDDPCNLTRYPVPTIWCASCKTAVPVHWVGPSPSSATQRYWLNRAFRDYLPHNQLREPWGIRTILEEHLDERLRRAVLRARCFVQTDDGWAPYGVEVFIDRRSLESARYDALELARFQLADAMDAAAREDPRLYDCRRELTFQDMELARREESRVPFPHGLLARADVIPDP